MRGLGHGKPSTHTGHKHSWNLDMKDWLKQGQERIFDLVLMRVGSNFTGNQATMDEMWGVGQTV